MSTVKHPSNRPQAYKKLGQAIHFRSLSKATVGQDI